MTQRQTGKAAELKELLDVCRAYGVVYLKTADFEVQVPLNAEMQLESTVDLGGEDEDRVFADRRKQNQDEETLEAQLNRYGAG
jgi:hypothetical protein